MESPGQVERGAAPPAGVAATPVEVVLRSASPRLKVRLAVVIVVALAGVSAMVLTSAFGAAGSSETIAVRTSSTASAPERAAIYVHIVGAVASPGLYRLSEGARGVDAVSAAGGFIAEADRGQLNLARIVVDGELISVPRVGETITTASGPGGETALVNINSADSAALETLPRIGPAVAKRIIDWRDTNGRFSTIDDLLAVPGIGEKTLDGFRALVTV